MTVKNSDQRVLALREVIAQRKKALGNPLVAKYKTNLVHNGKNILTMNLTEIRAHIGSLLSLKQVNDTVNALLGDNKEFDSQDVLDDLVLRGKILLYKQKESEIEQLENKLSALRSEDLRISDELDNLEQLLK